jgi:hypothetical protein
MPRSFPTIRAFLRAGREVPVEPITRRRAAASVRHCGQVSLDQPRCRLGTISRIWAAPRRPPPRAPASFRCGSADGVDRGARCRGGAARVGACRRERGLSLSWRLEGWTSTSGFWLSERVAAGSRRRRARACGRSARGLCSAGRGGLEGSDLIAWLSELSKSDAMCDARCDAGGGSWIGCGSSSRSFRRPCSGAAAALGGP